MQNNNHQQLYHIFLEFYIDPRQTLMHYDYHQQLRHQFLQRYNDQEHILM